MSIDRGPGGLHSPVVVESNCTVGWAEGKIVEPVLYGLFVARASKLWHKNCSCNVVEQPNFERLQSGARKSTVNNNPSKNYVQRLSVSENLRAIARASDKDMLGNTVVISDCANHRLFFLWTRESARSKWLWATDAA